MGKIDKNLEKKTPRRACMKRVLPEISQENGIHREIIPLNGIFINIH